MPGSITGGIEVGWSDGCGAAWVLVGSGVADALALAEGVGEAEGEALDWLGLGAGELLL
jgi:hypothetical protein